ncbi:pleurocidin-like peptide WF3 [Acanthopagrus latus]|uniref:pleurocidin-like peptide WF3 n=1 Tax=Acanthopagrus latus TaxID=8177 RepID=UPI00187CD8CA|nr:pleurocidin-like peptide WF3 [Acanthopagrus latus]
MKCTVVFLVLSMVVLMAEPGEGFLGLLISGAISAGTMIHDLVRQHHGDLQLEQLEQQLEQLEQQQQLDKRSLDAFH